MDTAFFRLFANTKLYLTHLIFTIDHWKVVSESYKIAKGKVLANILLLLVVKDGFLRSGSHVYLNLNYFNGTQFLQVCTHVFSIIIFILAISM